MPGILHRQFKLTSHLLLRWKHFPIKCQNKLYCTPTWIVPEGYDTGIMVYNSATKSKTPLKTMKKGRLSWYMCGPTVYDSAHIGHAICYVRFDIIRRVLLSIFNIDVVQVMGITDIDDKIIHKATDLGVNFRELTKKYETEFFEDMSKIRVLRPSVAPRVTDNIDNIIVYVQQIINNGYAYQVSDGSVYFSSEAYKRCGKLKKITSGEVGKLDKTSLKKSQLDFALWKGVKLDEPSWPSPWGPPGRPGWHIECSAMASRIFGRTLDLHSGGIDLLFPHHENEEAQCCAHDNTMQWCNYWMHTGHLFFKDRKMSKSLKNTISINKLIESYPVNAFRLFCLEKSYRSDIEFDPETSMNKAMRNLAMIKAFFHYIEAYLAGQINCGPLNDVLLLQRLSETRKNIKDSLADNFDYSSAYNAIMVLIELCNSELHTKMKLKMTGAPSLEVIASISSYVRSIFTIFGLHLSQKQDIAAEPEKFVNLLVSVVPVLLKFRESVRLFSTSNCDDKNLNSSQCNESHTLLDACKKLDAALLLTGLDVKKLDSTDLPESGARLSQVMNLLMQFRTTVRLFALLKTTPSLYSNLSKAEKKLVMKERSILLVECDTFRSDLTNLGFLIMDHPTSSTWSISKEM